MCLKRLDFHNFETCFSYVFLMQLHGRQHGNFDTEVGKKKLFMRHKLCHLWLLLYTCDLDVYYRDMEFI